MKRVPALDGLRAVAIAMVVAYHADSTVVPAGHWGVILFFILSGFLVTRVLVAEREKWGRIAIGRFYLKRWFRLTPPLAIVCTALLLTGTGWTKAAAALGYVANYARIEGVNLGLLTHTWFLAVLAHFYLVWPLVIAAVPGRHRLRVVGLLALATLTWRVVAIGVMSPAWVYNASDTNAVALLAGCWLALIPRRIWPLSTWSVPALLLLMLLPTFGDRGSAILWGGFIATGLGLVAVNHALSRPPWLERPMVVWFGQISYGLYLWHYVFVRSDMPLAVALVLGFAAAVASRYLIEVPTERLLARVAGQSRVPQADPD